MLPPARATRAVSFLAPTSTIWAWPLASKWVRGEVVTVGYKGLRSSSRWAKWVGYHSTMRMGQRLTAGLLAFLMAVAPLRADDLPELGDVASTELSLSAEKKIGQQIINEMRARETSYLDDADVEAELNQLGGLLG